MRSEVYSDQRGFGSLKHTLIGTRELDISIKHDDAKQWVEEHVKNNKQVYGQSSIVANEPHHQYLLDVMFNKHNIGTSLVNNLNKLIPKKKPNGTKKG